jgi:hypothetical protein
MTQLSFAYSSETVSGAKKDIESFKEEMTLKLNSVEQELAELHNKTKKKGAEIQENTIKDLEATRDKLRKELNNIEDSSKDNWKKFKRDFAKSMDSLNSKLQKALKD